MHWVPKIVQAIVVAIVLYYILVWGFDAVRALTSANYGLDDLARAQSVRGLGRLLDLGPADLVRLAAFVAAFKLAAVAVLTLHLIDRARSVPGALSNHDILEAALLLVVILTGVMTIPAVNEGSGSLIRQHAIDLLLAGTAAILSVIERLTVASHEQAEFSGARRPYAAVDPAGGRTLKRLSSWLWR